MKLTKDQAERIVKLVLEEVENRVGNLSEEIGCKSFDEIVERVLQEN